MENNAELKKLGLAGSFAIYIPSAILMFGLTKYLIPYLSEFTGQETAQIIIALTIIQIHQIKTQKVR